jgi:hypothetical protein
MIRGYLKKHLPKGSFILTLFSLIYLLGIMFLEGLRMEHWAIILGINVCFYAGKKSRKFILGFAIFVVYGIIYDLLRVFPNYQYNPVDIAPIYNLEKELFGFVFNGIRVTPNEYFAMKHNTFVDFLAGIAYINWVPVPLAFAAYLFYTDRRMFLNFSLTFLLVNLLGFMIYYIHPAAPPWYVARYGFGLDLNTEGNSAGLGRFDQLIHLKVFGSIYSKNANVFAAVPSLHCAYPLIVLYYGLKARCGWVNYLFGLLMAGIWFAAVYSGHHYLIDAILGVMCAIAGMTLYNQLLLKTNFFIKFINHYLKLIT